MSSFANLDQALEDIKCNEEQLKAVLASSHCVVLAGPGSGKTKTLTTAMARAVQNDILDPRGVACITYSNECVLELESRLAELGVVNNDCNFIGTIHSFSLTKIITPYVKFCPELSLGEFRIATAAESRNAIDAAFVATQIANTRFNWRLAEEKRKRDVDRSLPEWYGRDPHLAGLIEAYEAELRQNSLIDFDDMPIIALYIIKRHEWVRNAIRACFPVLFVDEYQDLGHALHELVKLLCLESNIRLFAVGDVDQSIYSFTGANPDLLKNLSKQSNIQVIKLNTNYRSGSNIIRASFGALGEERDYRGLDSAPPGHIDFIPVAGDLDAQARHISDNVVSDLIERYEWRKIAILYRDKNLGNRLSNALKLRDIVHIRSDSDALVKRSSRIGVFIENCAIWVTGGWSTANPSYSQLVRQAINLVYGSRVNDDEEYLISSSLITFLRGSIDSSEYTHAWLLRFQREVVSVWKESSRNPLTNWDDITEMIRLTDPSRNSNISLDVFSGRVDQDGCINLSTFHSSKGREFDAVILYGMNAGLLPNQYDQKSDKALREARRLFYVGVTRPRRELSIVYQSCNQSPWVDELYRRYKQQQDVQ